MDTTFEDNVRSFAMAHAKDISWNEINKAKYYLYGPSFFMAVRVLIHPFSVVKTRLQMQNESKSSPHHHHHALHYNGTFDAFRKIIKYEGSRGLYRGFAVSSLGIVSGQIYITTYEVTRESLLKANERNNLISPVYIDVVRNGIAGGCASLLSQTIVVPIDVISQKQMMQNKTIEGSILHAPREIFRRHGIFGFYKGYCASLAVYAPSSALWWGFYGYFREFFYRKAAHIGLIKDPNSNSYSRYMVEAGAAASAGVLSTVITNPMDVARTRLQVSGKVGDGMTLRSTLASLWREEGAKSTMKGVSARILATVPSSVLIITVYELVKRLSLN